VTLQPAIAYSAQARQLPDGVRQWLAALGPSVVGPGTGDEVMAISLRGRPRVIVLDVRDGGFDETLALLRRLKADAYTSVIPVVAVADNSPGRVAAAFAAGADEVISPAFDDTEAAIRLEAALRRSDRDIMVHPSTRLPGEVAIEAEIDRRMTARRDFAACYADLDHFKEFNDRYSYYQGDRVIQILSRILHDVVKGVCGEEGFVGHIGGDDFIFVIPIAPVPEVCSEIISVFDILIPLQYSDHDRRAGYFFGKDRRGQLHRVPLMTVSIGVVTTERRRFTHAAQVSALATEMKSYAKTLPGSVYSIDRRQDEPPTEPRRSGPIRLITPPTREGAGS
jgi:diguanylate cyclase (GGDEF)-like protein